MKNIEKYPETKTALEAYNSLSLMKVPFNEWLEFEYEEPCRPSLIDAASDAVAALAKNAVTAGYIAKGVIGKKIRVLRSVIDREKSKLIRNYDRFATADEAHKGFREMCDVIDNCEKCRFRDCDGTHDCEITWLFEEAKKRKRNEQVYNGD